MAMAQSAQVARMLSAGTGCLVDLVGYTTFGDVSKAELAQIGGTGVFVSELRQRLVNGDIDFAVHSLKDLPTVQDAALLLAAIPPREDPRDALVARSGAKLADLPAGARIGTGSPRRAAQLLLLRPDLQPVAIRETRNPPGQGRRRRGRRRRPRLCRAGKDRLRRGQPGLRAEELMLPRPGCAGGGMHGDPAGTCRPAEPDR
jgi:hydroxymethylbilane synthase